MSKTLSFVAYASSVNQSAAAGGTATRSLSLQGVTGDQRAKPPVAGPNDAMFDLPGSGRAQVTLTGLTEAAIAGFKGGTKYRVTIQEVHETPAAKPAPAADSPTPAVPAAS